MTILILGASGLVGSHCLQLLLADHRFDTVIALVRRPLGIKHPKLKEVVVDFDRLDSYAGDIKADAVLSMMGTTIRKAGSPTNFTKVDYAYQLKVAEIARRNGAQAFVLLSSMGADKKSSVLYTRVKGEVEEAISRLGYNKLVILRPSILLGERNESRPAEAMAQWVFKKMPFIFSGFLERYKGIPVEIVARAMINAVQNPYKGQIIVENLEIFKWAKD